MNLDLVQPELELALVPWYLRNNNLIPTWWFMSPTLYTDEYSENTLNMYWPTCTNWHWLCFRIVMQNTHWFPYCDHVTKHRIWDLDSFSPHQRKVHKDNQSHMLNFGENSNGLEALKSHVTCISLSQYRPATNALKASFFLFYWTTYCPSCLFH